MNRLEGRTVLITGAGSGLGRESAKLFAAEGANVVVTDLNASRVDAVVTEIIDAGGQAVGTAYDVRDRSQGAAAVALGLETYGALDGLMCSAGIPEEGFGMTAFEDLDLDAMENVIATNLMGVVHACRAVIPTFKAAGGGTILAVSSMSSFVAYPGFPVYGASKHGVNGLVKGLSLDLGSAGIRINALCPAHGMSVNFVMGLESPVLGQSYEEVAGPWDPAASSIPLKLPRPPRLEDNARAALFLMSDDSAYMSGVCLPATDGGTLARVAIVFPGDLGGETAVLPAELPV